MAVTACPTSHRDHFTRCSRSLAVCFLTAASLLIILPVCRSVCPLTKQDVFYVRTLYIVLHRCPERSNQTKPQSNLRRAASQMPHWLQWDASTTPQNCPFSFDDHHHPSDTPIPRPTPLTTPNGIRIHSAVLPQYILRTDRQIDRWSRRMFHNMSHLNSLYLIESAAANNEDYGSAKMFLIVKTRPGAGVYTIVSASHLWLNRMVSGR